MTADDVITTIERFFDNPADVWQESFRLSSPLERQILLTLATLPFRPWSVDVVRDLAAPTDALEWTPALHILEATWLDISGEATGRLVALANPGCRDYLLGVLDDTAVALDQLNRVALLPQLVSLVQSAGLSEPLFRRGSTPARAELAGALSRQREQVLAQLQQLTETALASASTLASRVPTLYQAAMVLKALATSDSTRWFLDLVADATGSDIDQMATVPVVNGFALAEIMVLLPTDEPNRQQLLASTVALRSVQAISTLHDLDAFEALPDDLKSSPDLQTAARKRAQVAIGFEYSQALDAALDADDIETTAQDLAQRAQYYDIALEIGPLLDRVDNLRRVNDLPDWPSTDYSDEDDAYGNLNVHQVFAQLGANEPED